MAIGQSVKRLDGPAKVTGRARYTDDLTMPGMRFAAYVRSPIAHGRVTRIDTAKALALPGVCAVFTFADVPKTLFPTAGHPWHLDPDHRDVADTLLLTDHPRYHGDQVAIVVACDQLTATLAAGCVDVEYEALPVMVTPASALAEGAPALHAWSSTGNLLRSHHFACGGDPESLLAQAALTVQGVYNTPIAQHCHMENHTAYAYMDDLERVVVVSSTQIPHICRRVVGQALGIPWSRVRVVKPCVGGGFGAKQDVILEPMVAFLAMKLGLPVKLELTREESILATRTRHAFEISGSLGVDQEGTITAVSLSAVANTGAYASHGHSIASAGGAKCSSLYPRAAFGYLASTVYTTLPVAGAMRGYGSPQVHFALDCLVEQAARARGEDPVAFRLRNVGRPGDVNPLNRKVMATHGMVRCLETGRDLFNWEARRTALRNQTGPLRRGVGVACFSFNTGVYPVSAELAGARLLLNQDGTMQLIAGATEIGQGVDTVLAQMAAHTLGVPVSMIQVVSTQDTDVSAFDPGAYASRQTYVAAPAVKGAAQEMRAKLLAHAALMLERHDLDLRAGNIVDPEGAVLAGLADVAMDAFYHKERGGQFSAECSHKTTSNPPSFGCTFVEVEVDIPLCRTRVVDILNVHDAGVVMNPQLARGQVQGGMAMGIGWALYEELLVDAKTGLVHNNTLLDYKIPTCPDLPDLGCAFVETQEPSGAYGSKSLGEPPILSPAPAIRNAVWDATGVRIDEIPLTPKTLFRHFSAAGLI